MLMAIIIKIHKKHQHKDLQSRVFLQPKAQILDFLLHFSNFFLVHFTEILDKNREIFKP